MNTAVICPIVDGVGKIADGDGKCTADDEAADGKSVVVKTGAVNKDSKIFTSFENNPRASSWIEKKKGPDGNYEGFVIYLDSAIESEIVVNWWLVQEK
jgi:hypothetical protein